MYRYRLLNDSIYNIIVNFFKSFRKSKFKKKYNSVPLHALHQLGSHLHGSSQLNGDHQGLKAIVVF